MATTTRVEFYGTLSKQEVLQTLEDYVHSNSFVLEAHEPFPGFFNYYSARPVESKPLYVYLVAKMPYTLEQVTRATQKIKSYFPEDFSATAGVVTMLNREYSVIRVRHLRGYDVIPGLQACYNDEGIEFSKRPSTKIEGKADIKIIKVFILDEVSEELFFDVEEVGHGYFPIPNMLTWKQFESVTMQVKHNWAKPAFDAATGYFHRGTGITDMIRVFSPGIDIEYLSAVRKAYYERL